MCIVRTSSSIYNHEKRKFLTSSLPNTASDGRHTKHIEASHHEERVCDRSRSCYKAETEIPKSEEIGVASATQESSSSFKWVKVGVGKWEYQNVMMGGNEKKEAIEVAELHGHNEIISSPVSHTTDVVKMEERECDICYERMTSITLACGDSYCKECLEACAQQVIDQGKNEYSVTCPNFLCAYTLSDEEVQSVTEPTTYARLLHLRKVHRDSMQNKEWLYCPNVKCAKQVFVGKDDKRAKCAECGTKFCALCFEVHSKYVNCTVHDMGHSICSPKHGFTQAWKLINTKPCPTCGDRIEKNGGCHHMLCRSCGENFCWRCGFRYGKNWENSGFHCKKYVAAGVAGGAVAVGAVALGVVVVSPLLLAGAIIATPIAVGAGVAVYAHHKVETRRRRRERQFHYYR